MFPSNGKDCSLIRIRRGEKWGIHEIGAYGEEVAKQFLRVSGAKVIYTNFRSPSGGEIDIIARDGDVLCFVEVKSRTKHYEHSRPMDAVDAKKRRYIFRGAKAWRQLLRNEDYLWRYDVVEVILEREKRPDVTWVKEAFTEG